MTSRGRWSNIRRRRWTARSRGRTPQPSWSLLHLHRLGAARAQSITFVADGGVWIWERIAAIVRLAKLDRVAIYEVLDCYHAAHHISHWP